jgi:hypothetical protein
MSRLFRLTGTLFIILALPLVIRTVWESTWLTWSQGQQMIGFTSLHLHPGLAILSRACWLATFPWLIAMLGLALTKQRALSVGDRSLGGIAAVVLLLPVIPVRAWQSGTELFLGASPKAGQNLTWAAAIGDTGTVEHLLKLGVSADSTDDQGCPAVAVAAGSGNNTHRVMPILIAAKANPNAACGGDTALHRAAQRGDLETVKLLISAGADRYTRNAQGLTPSELASLKEHTSVSQFLDSGQ